MLSPHTGDTRDRHNVPSNRLIAILSAISITAVGISVALVASVRAAEAGRLPPDSPGDPAAQMGASAHVYCEHFRTGFLHGI